MAESRYKMCHLSPGHARVLGSVALGGTSGDKHAEGGVVAQCGSCHPQSTHSSSCLHRATKASLGLRRSPDVGGGGQVGEGVLLTQKAGGVGTVHYPAPNPAEHSHIPVSLGPGECQAVLEQGAGGPGAPAAAGRAGRQEDPQHACLHALPPGHRWHLAQNSQAGGTSYGLPICAALTGGPREGRRLRPAGGATHPPGHHPLFSPCGWWRKPHFLATERLKGPT